MGKYGIRGQNPIQSGLVGFCWVDQATISSATPENPGRARITAPYVIGFDSFSSFSLSQTFRASSEFSLKGITFGMFAAFVVELYARYVRLHTSSSSSIFLTRRARRRRFVDQHRGPLPRRAFEDVFEPEGRAWQAGLTITYPLGRLGEKARYRDELALHQLEQKILVA